MYRQQAERLAHKIGLGHPQLCVDLFQDGTRRSSWLVRIYDPISRQTFAVDGERQAMERVDELRARQ
jgi:hypothetical protein